MPEAEADARFERIARNAKVVKGHSLGAAAPRRGRARRAGAGVSRTTWRTSPPTDAPVAWQPPVEPVIVRQNGVGLMREAKHPAAAALFAEWALGAGQAAYASSGYRSTRRDADAPDTAIRAIDEERLAAERDRWIDGWERLIALGEPTAEGG